MTLPNCKKLLPVVFRRHIGAVFCTTARFWCMKWIHLMAILLPVFPKNAGKMRKRTLPPCSLFISDD
jgi:hypothetical protein